MADNTMHINNDTPTPLPFEAAAARLEEIVKLLEDGTLPLERSLSLYEEGVGLVRACAKELNEAEQRVKVLQRNADNQIKPADFVGTED